MKKNDNNDEKFLIDMTAIAIYEKDITILNKLIGSGVIIDQSLYTKACVLSTIEVVKIVDQATYQPINYQSLLEDMLISDSDDAVLILNHLIEKGAKINPFNDKIKDLYEEAIKRRLFNVMFFMMEQGMPIDFNNHFPLKTLIRHNNKDVEKLYYLYENKKTAQEIIASKTKSGRQKIKMWLENQIEKEQFVERMNTELPINKKTISVKL